jgi:divalent metal cation (Fe/Co/Zn/Cd) transporter
MGSDRVPPRRAALARRGKQLEYFTIAWNTAEALVALVAGVLAGSISLLGFGVDSFIEVASGGILLWRMSSDADKIKRERREITALRAVGACFLALAVYVGCEAAVDLASRQPPKPSAPGIVLAMAAVLVMPLLSRAKRRVGAELESAAMAADAAQTQFCAYLSLVLLAGLVLNAAFGFWWADPAAALIMVPILAREGINGLRGKTCCSQHR